MKKYTSILFIIFRLALGGMMIYGGIQKFQKPNPSALEVLEKANKFSSPSQELSLQKTLYINGLKQTGYFWQVLGAAELIFGILLVLQLSGFIGALLLLPITLQIFLFHLFLEYDEVGELIQWFFWFGINIALVLREYPKWKHLLWMRPLL